MTLFRSESLVPVARRAALAGLGLAMLPVGVALWHVVAESLAILGLPNGETALGAAVVSAVTALHLAAVVVSMAQWWYDRETLLWLALTLVSLYATYFYLVGVPFRY